MKRTFYQHCLVLFLLSFASTALSDRGVEEQKAKLLDLIVESEDPEVRKKLLGIYESLGTSATGSSQPKRATSKFSGPLSEDEVKEFELLSSLRAKCGSSKQKLKAKFGPAGENYYVKTSSLEGKPFTYTYNQLKDNSYPSSREKEIHKHHYFLEKSCFERAVGQVSAAAVEKTGFTSFWAEYERIQDSFLKGNLTFSRRYELETGAIEKLRGVAQASMQNVLQDRKALQAAATRGKDAKQAAVIKECEDNGGAWKKKTRAGKWVTKVLTGKDDHGTHYCDRNAQARARAKQARAQASKEQAEHLRDLQKACIAAGGDMRIYGSTMASPCRHPSKNKIMNCDVSANGRNITCF